MTAPLCHKCGCDDVLVWGLPQKAVCPDCCPDHEYMYEGQGDGWMCQNCGIYPPNDLLVEARDALDMAFAAIDDHNNNGKFHHKHIFEFHTEVRNDSNVASLSDARGTLTKLNEALGVSDEG